MYRVKDSTICYVGLRAVLNIKTVVFDAEDTLHVNMSWFSCDLIVFQYKYHRRFKTCYLCFLPVSSRGDTPGECPTRGGRCTSGCTRRWLNMSRIHSSKSVRVRWLILKGYISLDVQVCHGELNGSVLVGAAMIFVCGAPGRCHPVDTTRPMPPGRCHPALHQSCTHLKLSRAAGDLWALQRSVESWVEPRAKTNCKKYR